MQHPLTLASPRKEEKRDKLYSAQLSSSELQIITENALANKATDLELGVPYTIYPIETKPDGEKVFHSTLIEYPFGSSPRASAHDTNPRGIILYVHGYNDYFFQKELAEKSDSAGFAFFAIDLHYNGRSYSEGEPRSDMRSVKEYFAELDAAVALSKRIATKNSGNLPFIVIGHSQGGLITPNYLNERSKGRFCRTHFEQSFPRLQKQLVCPQHCIPRFLRHSASFPRHESTRTRSTQIQHITSQKRKRRMGIQS